MISLIIILICLLLNALFSCAEMAFVAADATDLRNKTLENDGRAKYIEANQKNPERILSVVQIGITFVGAISAAVSGAVAEETIAPWISDTFDIQNRIAETIAISSVVIPLTIGTVIFGELLPKSIAIRSSLKTVLSLAPGLRIAEKLLGPLVNPMERVTRYILSLLIKEDKGSLKKEGETLPLNGLIREHREYVKNLAELNSKIARNSMLPWNEVAFINAEDSAETVLNTITETHHTRLPVIANNEVCGFLHTKEFLQLFKNGIGENWLSFIRPPIFIHPTLKLFTALKLMKKQKIHLLIVGVAEKPLGILTLEDVIEEVVGDIEDEDEDERVLDFLRLTKKDTGPKPRNPYL